MINAKVSMSLPKFLALLIIVLFGSIGIAAYYKSHQNQRTEPKIAQVEAPLEIELDQNIQEVVPAATVVTIESSPLVLSPPPISSLGPQENSSSQNNFTHVMAPVAIHSSRPLPEANRIDRLFNVKGPKLPIVETITYKSQVPWQKGRPAWISDYASYYSTSRHFIARSLNNAPDYFKQEVANGDQFNVFRKDKNINFYLLIDTSRCKMWFYYVDLDLNERVLLKTYLVGLGRIDGSKLSGMLTPLGKYNLGSKIAIYKPKVVGIHNNKKVEMVQIFGSRWIPFDKELSGCTAPAKGFGIHGVPWVPNEQNELIQDRTSLGKYESDGCIRLATEDIEELFAIIITKPTIVELVKDFHEAKLPGEEK